MKIAIVAIAYNRIDSIRRLINSLQGADYEYDSVSLIISIDKSDTEVVENYADAVIWNNGEKRVIKHKENLGLRKHILSIGKYLNEFDAIIVFEDDIIVSPNYYLFAKSAVERYKDNSQIAGISLYGFAVNYQNKKPFYPLKNEYDVYFMNCAQSWGQVWMRDQWNAFVDWYRNHNEEFVNNGNLPQAICDWPKSSWLKYHTKYCIEENKYFVYPYQSYSSNGGDAGTHASFSNLSYQTCFNWGKWSVPKFPKIEEGVVYDGFFENKSIVDFLELDDDICVDLYGGKNNIENKRYWLTTKKENYLVVKSFGLIYKPIELNVIQKVKGGDIYLYDTSRALNNIRRYDRRKLYNYYYGQDVVEHIRWIGSYGLRNCMKLILLLCMKRLRKCLKRRCVY